MFALIDLPKSFISRYRDLKIMRSVRPYTMASFKRTTALLNAVTYITKNNIKGDIVECGLWKGGSLMAVIKKLMFYGDYNRMIWAFDTFEGMTPPEDHDVDLYNNNASILLDGKSHPEIDMKCFSNYEETTSNVLSTGYPSDKLQFIKGDVVNTLPSVNIENIALLHLDTDWYASTKIELEILYPRLVKGGVMIIDDYGHWRGCRKAVDQYVESNKLSVKMVEIDYTARLIIKE